MRKHLSTLIIFKRILFLFGFFMAVAPVRVSAKGQYGQLAPLPEINYESFLYNRPEGELKYYEVSYKYYYVSGNKDYKEMNAEGLFVPVVFTSNNEVYIKNLIGFRGPTHGCGAWTKGIYDEEAQQIKLPVSAVFAYNLYGRYGDNPYGFFQFYPSKFVSVANGYEIKALPDKDFIILSKNEKGEFILSTESRKEGFSYYGSLFWPEYFYYDSEYFYYDLRMIPSDFVCIQPPSGYEAEKYQITFGPYASAFEDKTAGLLLNCIVAGNEIYFQGMSNILNEGNDELWVKGNIRGNKVVFENGLPLGVNTSCSLLYFNSMDYYWGNYGTHYDYLRVKATSLDTNLEFDYSEDKLSNPSSSFGFPKEPYGNWETTTSIVGGVSPTAFGFHDFFYKPEIKKIPKKRQVPQKPRMSYSSKNEECTISATYFDTEGYVIDPSKLFIKITRYGLPLLIDPSDINEKYCYHLPLELLPLEMINQVMFDDKGMIGPSSYYFTLKNAKEYGDTVELLYINGDEIISSNEADAKVEINESYPNIDDATYDLSGRKVNPSNLAPGMYIRNGKKFVVK